MKAFLYGIILFLNIYIVNAAQYEDEKKSAFQIALEDQFYFSRQHEYYVSPDFATLEKLIQENNSLVNQFIPGFGLPLSFAVNYKLKELIKFLLSKGANPNVQGRTNPLSLVEDYETALLLLLNGANPQLKIQDINGRDTSIIEEIKKRIQEENWHIGLKYDLARIEHLFKNWPTYGQAYIQYLKNFYFEKLEQLEKKHGLTGMPKVLNALIAEYAQDKVLTVPEGAMSFEEFITKLQQAAPQGGAALAPERQYQQAQPAAAAQIHPAQQAAAASRPQGAAVFEPQQQQQQQTNYEDYLEIDELERKYACIIQ
jgi:hypothetical protein